MLARMVGSGVVVRLRPDTYWRKDDLTLVGGWDRFKELGIHAVRRASGGLILVRESAAVLHGLAIPTDYRQPPE